MRTLIQGGWVVGFDGHSHRLFRDGSLVYEDDRILHVGPRFEGLADRTIDARGMLVMPGLINRHLHLGTNAPHAYLLDETKADYFGANFYAYSVPRRGAYAYSVPRRGAAEARAGNRADIEQLYGLWSAIRGGATTVLDIGTRNWAGAPWLSTSRRCGSPSRSQASAPGPVRPEWHWRHAAVEDVAPVSYLVDSAT